MTISTSSVVVHREPGEFRDDLLLAEMAANDGMPPEEYLALASHPCAVLDDLDAERAAWRSTLLPFETLSKNGGGDGEKPARAQCLLTAATAMAVVGAMGVDPYHEKARQRVDGSWRCGARTGMSRMGFAAGGEFTVEVAKKGWAIADYCRANICPACRAYAYSLQGVFAAMAILRGMVLIARSVTCRAGSKTASVEYLREVARRGKKRFSTLGVPRCWVMDPVLGPRDGWEVVLMALVPADAGAARHAAVGDALQELWDDVAARSRGLTKHECMWGETRVLATQDEYAEWYDGLIAGPPGWQEDVELMAEAAKLSQGHRFCPNDQWDELREEFRARPREVNQDVVLGVKVEEAIVRRDTPERRLQTWAVFLGVAAVNSYVVVVARDGRWLLGEAAAEYARGMLTAEATAMALRENEDEAVRRRRGVEGPDPVARRGRRVPGSAWRPEWLPVPAYAM